MAKHFMAVLGTSLYEPVIYEDKSYKATQEFEYVQMAIIDKYKEVLAEDDAKITIFVTSFSKTQNYLDRAYSQRDVESAGRWVSDRKAQVMEGANKKGLETQFKEVFPELFSKFECVEIPDMKSEEELWTGFQMMYENLREGDEVIFDLTHAFRSIPMLAITIIEYAKILKNCSLLDISYGAFEAAEKGLKPKRVPLINLNVYDEIINWSHAANVFMRYGQADMMKELYSAKLKQVPVEEKKVWKPVENVLNAAENLSDAVLISRGADGEKLVHDKKTANKPKYSVKSAFQMFKEKSNEAVEEKAKQVQPLYPLFKKAQERFEIFDREKNYEVGLAVTEWSIQNNLIQQGYTSLEESIITFLCDYLGLHELDRDIREDVVSFWTIEYAQASRNNKMI